MSNWEQRPLSSKQVEYAALDAFVLVEIYDVITDPYQGLTQEQLDKLTYSFMGQARQHQGTTSNPKNTSSVDDQQPEAQTTLQDCIMELVPPPKQQLEQNNVCQTGNSESLSSSPAAMSDGQSTAAGVAMPSGSRQSHDTSTPNPVASRVQPSMAEAGQQQEYKLPPGLHLQRCLQDNGLQGVVKPFAPGAG